MRTALLLSGGMDSNSIAFWKRPDYGLTIDYGQNPAAGEKRAASAVCETLNIDHINIVADISALGSGDLIGKPSPRGSPASEWWPYRNQFLLSVAAMKCYSLGVSSLMIGALKTDGFHADGTIEFINAMNVLLNLQEGELSIFAPAISMTAEELIQKSGIPESVLCWSHSCHVSDVACGFCRGCKKHYETMEACYGLAY